MPAPGERIPEIDLQQESHETARSIVKFIKENTNQKSQVEIQGFSSISPSRDDLQSVMDYCARRLWSGTEFGITAQLTTGLPVPRRSDRSHLPGFE